MPTPIFSRLSIASFILNGVQRSDRSARFSRFAYGRRAVDAHEVSLRRELEFLGLYLSTAQIRFADRLQIKILTDPATQDASVPLLILQPIVENAIRHGIGRSSLAGRILISAYRVLSGANRK